MFKSLREAFLSHKSIHTTLSFSLFSCFLELIAGVPRGAQNFGYVSMNWNSSEATQDRLALLQAKTKPELTHN